MPIRLECLACGAKMSAPDRAAGKTVKCPRCNVPTPVPERKEAITPGLPVRKASVTNHAAGPLPAVPRGTDPVRLAAWIFVGLFGVSLAAGGVWLLVMAIKGIDATQVQADKERREREAEEQRAALDLSTQEEDAKSLRLLLSAAGVNRSLVKEAAGKMQLHTVAMKKLSNDHGEALRALQASNDKATEKLSQLQDLQNQYTRDRARAQQEADRLKAEHERLSREERDGFNKISVQVRQVLERHPQWKRVPPSGCEEVAGLPWTYR